VLSAPGKLDEVQREGKKDSTNSPQRIGALPTGLKECFGGGLRVLVRTSRARVATFRVEHHDYQTPRQFEEFQGKHREHKTVERLVPLDAGPKLEPPTGRPRTIRTILRFRSEWMSR
jgi:hypothetical protein